MSNELHAETTTGLTVYCVLLNATGQVWTGAAFAALSTATWTDCAIAITEAQAGIYLADMPTPTAGAYSYVVYSQAGVDPAVTDDIKGTGYIIWDGTAEVTTEGYSLTAAYDSAKTASQAGDSMALTAAAVDAILDEVVQGTWTLRKLLKVISAALAAKTSGGGTATFVVRDIDDTKNLITFTLDTSGNRLAVTFNVT